VATLSGSANYVVGSPSSATVTITEEPPPTVTINVTTPATNELSTSPGVLTVTRNGPTDTALTVNYTVSGAAVNGTDYSTLSGTITIPAGQSSAAINVSPLDDGDGDDANASEAMTATLSSSSAYSIGGTGQASVIIDEEPTVTISATTATTAEDGAFAGVFTASRTGATDAPLTVNYALSGTAVIGTDYQNPGGSVTIPAGQGSTTISINPLDDGVGDESQGPVTVLATIASGGAYYIGSPNTATVTINEEPPPNVTIAATRPSTQEMSAVAGVFTVSRSGPTDDPLTVNFSVSGSAIAGADYTATGTSVTIPAGQSSATINVSPLDDGDGDDSGSSESVVATLSSSSNYTVGTPNQATVNVYEEPVVTIAATANTAEFSGSPGLFTVSRTGLTDSPLTIYYNLGGTAVAGTDYSGPTGSVTIASGYASTTIVINPLDDGDGDDGQSGASVMATLAAGSGYVIGAPNQATLTVAEEAPPTVSITATTATTLETGSSPGVFTVSRTGPTDDPVVVQYSVSGSATPGTDYTSLSGSVTIPIGQASVPINVSPNDDGDGDDTTPSNTVTASISSALGYTVGSPSSATVIINEDFIPTVSVSASPSSIAEVGGSGNFVVTLSGAAASNITVAYTVSGSASSGTDYQALSGSVVVPAGQTTANITVTPLDDGDGDEIGSTPTITVMLQSGSGYHVGSPNNATMTITEDAPPPTVSISTTNPTTAEAGGSPGVFTVSLSSPPTTSLTVYYSIEGTAVNNTDYQTLNGSVVFFPGQSSTNILVSPLDDGDSDDGQGPSYVTLTLTSAAGYNVGSPTSATVTINEESGGHPQILSLPPTSNNPNATPVNVAEVRAMVAAGALRWFEAGMRASVILADLRGLRINVSDLPGSILGLATPREGAVAEEITIDINAAGYGWFIDSTPLDDSEFNLFVAPSERLATGAGPATGHVDLLTVVMHELGHLFGLPDLPEARYPFDVMNDMLDLSTRRIPLPGPPDAPGSTPREVGANAVVDGLFRDLGALKSSGGTQLLQVAGLSRYLGWLD
jgi:hypothetical protein